MKNLRFLKNPLLLFGPLVLAAFIFDALGVDPPHTNFLPDIIFPESVTLGAALILGGFSEFFFKIFYRKTVVNTTL